MRRELRFARFAIIFAFVAYVVIHATPCASANTREIAIRFDTIEDARLKHYEVLVDGTDGYTRTLLPTACGTDICMSTLGGLEGSENYTVSVRAVADDDEPGNWVSLVDIWARPAIDSITWASTDGDVAPGEELQGGETYSGTITGASFRVGATIEIIDAPFVAVDSVTVSPSTTQIEVSITIGDNAIAGLYRLEVINPSQVFGFEDSGMLVEAYIRIGDVTGFGRSDTK